MKEITADSVIRIKQPVKVHRASGIDPPSAWACTVIDPLRDRTNGTTMTETLNPDNGYEPRSVEGRPKRLLLPTTLTVDQAALLFGISRTLMYNCVNLGLVPSLKFGGRSVIPTMPALRMVGLL